MAGYAVEGAGPVGPGLRLPQAELLDWCLAGLAGNNPPRAGLRVALGCPFAGCFFVFFGLGVLLHGDLLVCTFGTAASAGRITTSVVVRATPALAPGVGWPPAPGDGLLVGVGVVPDGVGVGELDDGVGELVGDDDPLWPGDVVGDADGDPPRGPGFVMHG